MKNINNVDISTSHFNCVDFRLADTDIMYLITMCYCMILGVQCAMRVRIINKGDRQDKPMLY